MAKQHTEPFELQLNLMMTEITDPSYCRINVLRGEITVEGTRTDGNATYDEAG